MNIPNTSTVSSTEGNILPQSKKSVRFSATIAETICVDGSTSEENVLKWYTQGDKNRFMRIWARDVAGCNRMLAAKAAMSNSNMKVLLSEEELAKCVGLEAMFTRNPANRLRVIAEMKRRHIVTVLREQARQNAANAWDEEIFARVSRASSQWSHECSHCYAMRYATS